MDGTGIMTAGLDAMTLPSRVPALESKPAPMPLLRVQAFVNTQDRDQGTDVLADAGEARVWLADAGLRGPSTRGTGETDAEQPDPDLAADLRLAREVRDGIRALIGHDGNEPLGAAGLEPLEQVLAEAQPRLAVTADGRVRLGPTLPAARLTDGLLALLLIIRDAQADGRWDRLKLCGNPDCRWAFYDRSHSRRGAWCDMASCGNRLKNRNLRARRARADSPR
jgi:predicted RNA-binding Zn ribbon-like protein